MSIVAAESLWSQLTQAKTSSDLELLYGRLRSNIVAQPQYAAEFITLDDRATQLQRLTLVITLREAWALSYSETWQLNLLLAQHISLAIGAAPLHFDSAKTRAAERLINNDVAAYQVERALLKLAALIAQQLTLGQEEVTTVKAYWRELAGLAPYWQWQWLHNLLTRPPLKPADAVNGPKHGSILEPWAQTQQRQLQVRAPHGLLKYLQHFRAGGGKLSALVMALQQRQELAHAVVQSADNEMRKQHRNGTLSTTPLKQALLWLGPERSAIAIATSALATQLQSNYFPLQPLVMQHVRCAAECVRLLAHTSDTKLPASPQLIVLLWSASLFRSQQLQHQPRHSVSLISELQSWHCSAWFGLHQPARHRKLSQELAKRWQLPNRVVRMVAEPFSEELSAEAALLIIASSIVVSYFYPQAKLSISLQQQLAFALRRLNLSRDQYHYLRCQQAVNQQAWCPLPMLAT